MFQWLAQNNYERSTMEEDNILDLSEKSSIISSEKFLEDAGIIDKSALDELKHSIKVHMILSAKPTEQLCVFLLKVVDAFETNDKEVRDSEMANLSFTIVEGIATFIHKSIDERIQKSKAIKSPFPQAVSHQCDEILILIGKGRQVISDVNSTFKDKQNAKNVVLKGIANALRALATQTKAVYPDLYDSSSIML